MSLATLNGVSRSGPFEEIDNDYLFDEMVLLPPDGAGHQPHPDRG